MFGDKFVVNSAAEKYTKFENNLRGKYNHYEEGQVVVALDNSTDPYTMPLEVFEKYNPQDFLEAIEITQELGMFPWALNIEQHLEKVVETNK